MATYGEESDFSNLEDSFVGFAEAALKQAATQISAESIPRHYHTQIVFENNSSFKKQLFEQIDYEQILRKSISKILDTEEVRQCVLAHLQASIPARVSSSTSDDILAEYPSSIEATRTTGALLSPIIEVLQLHNTLTPTRKQILESYRRFLEAWTATTTREDATIPLLNFKIDQVQLPVKISTNYHIAPFSPTEKTAFWGVVDAFQGWDLFPFLSFIAMEFKLEGSRSYPRMQPQASQQAIDAFSRSHQAMLEEIRDIVTALRLLQPGDIGVTAYLERDTLVPPYGSGHPHMGIPSVILSDFRVRRHGAIYSLEGSKVPVACQLAEALQQLNKRPHRGGLEIALSRFNQSYGRDFPDDRIIDLTIASESCLLAAIKSQTELKYRFALRGAALLANFKKPQETNKQLAALYNVRSSIVHEGKHLFEQKSASLISLQPNEFLQLCEDIVRDILREYVQMLVNKGTQSSISTINEELDQRILSGLGAPDEHR